jgi:predicted metal-binding membrane protein
VIGAVVSGRTTRRGVSTVIVGAIATAWSVAIAADLTGSADLFHHDSLLEGSLPLAAAIGLFVVAWQLMIAAMMLPSSMPLIRLFGAVAVKQDRPAAAMGALLGGYATVWMLFGLAAFVLDAVVHQTVHRVPWLEARPNVIAGSVLILAGAFQFSDLKDRCLRECRHPGPFLMSRYARGIGAAFRLGVAHGGFCVGCCWALMLVGFASGVANLWWMAALTALMVYEKTARRGSEAVAPIGVGLLVAGFLTMLR